MSRLVLNEIYKIFHKKSVIITLFIIFLFVLLVTFLYKQNIDNTIIYGDEVKIRELENKINNYDFNKGSKNEYASLLASLETEKYVLGKPNSWQIEKYYRYISDLIYESYATKYVLNDEDGAYNIRQRINYLLNKLEDNDWAYFVSLELQEVDNNIKELEQSNTLDQKMAYETYLYQKKLLNYRLDNNVSYSDGYLNDVINEQEFLINDKIAYDMADTPKLKENYQKSYANFKENEYILEHKIDTKSEQTLRAIIKNYFSEFTFLIVVFIIMISGSIVSDEFHRGTIKSLLIVPYTRDKIIIAKYITVLLMIPFIILFILLCLMLLGGIFFGYETLFIPVIGYNFNLNEVEVISLGKYFIYMFFGNLPMLLELVTLAFCLSSLLLSTAFAITLSLCGFIAASFINAFALEFKLKFLNYFVTPNWDLTYLVFGGHSPYGISLNTSIIICLIYLLFMFITSVIVFRKRNIKNI